MQNQARSGLRIHAALRPGEAGAKDAAPTRRARPRRPRGFLKRRRHPVSLSLGDRLLRDTAVACAVLLGVLTMQNIDQPWSRLALNGVESALTMRINLDESLGRLSFVRGLVPESALVFLDLNARETFAPVEGTIVHAWTESQPWIAYQCPAGAQVRALEPGTVTAVSRLNGGEWGLLIDHGEGIESVFAYLGGTCVQMGDAVSAGQVIGQASDDGEISVYFELRRNGQAIDPAERLRL